MMARSLEGYGPKKYFQQPSHAVEKIPAFNAMFSKNDAYRAVRRQLDGYLTQDALIGNADRHPENLGLLG